MNANRVYSNAFGSRAQPLHAEDYAIAKTLEQVSQFNGETIFMAVYGRPNTDFTLARSLSPCTDGQARKAKGCASCLRDLEIPFT
jgi:hypothetical protein